MAKRSFFHRLVLDGSGETQGVLGHENVLRTHTEHTYITLREDIVEGRLEPGSKLRIEYLRAQYDVGAGTLREALTRLVSDALVIAEGQRGFQVAPMTLEELQDITNLRVRIETESLRQSIRSGDEQWRAALVDAYAALSAEEQPISAQRRRQWELLNARFHEALLAGDASPWTLRVLRLLSRHSERYRFCAMGLKDSVRDVHAEHTMIFELAMDGQDARAALALEAHIRATPDMLIKALRDGRATLAGTALPLFGA